MERFPLFTNEELKEKIKKDIPPNTSKNSCWGYDVYQKWAENRNSQIPDGDPQMGTVPVDLSKATHMQLNFWLSRFIVEARRADGNPYPPNTIYNIICAIQVSRKINYLVH